MYIICNVYVKLFTVKHIWNCWKIINNSNIIKFQLAKAVRLASVLVAIIQIITDKFRGVVLIKASYFTLCYFQFTTKTLIIFCSAL